MPTAIGVSAGSHPRPRAHPRGCLGLRDTWLTTPCRHRMKMPSFQGVLLELDSTSRPWSVPASSGRAGAWPSRSCGRGRLRSRAGGEVVGHAQRSEYQWGAMVRGAWGEGPGSGVGAPSVRGVPGVWKPPSHRAVPRGWARPLVYCQPVSPSASLLSPSLSSPVRHCRVT